VDIALGRDGHVERHREDVGLAGAFLDHHASVGPAGTELAVWAGQTVRCRPGIGVRLIVRRFVGDPSIDAEESDIRIETPPVALLSLAHHDPLEPAVSPGHDYAAVRDRESIYHRVGLDPADVLV